MIIANTIVLRGLSNTKISEIMTYRGKKRWNFIVDQREKGIQDEKIAAEIGITVDSMRVWMSRNKDVYATHLTKPVASTSSLIPLIERINQRVALTDQNEKSINILQTDFGEEFEDKFLDLKGSSLLFAFFPVVYQSQLKFTQGNFFEELLDTLDVTIKGANISNQKREKALNLYKEIKELWHEGESKFNELNELLSDPNTKESTIPEEPGNNKQIESLNITERVNAYFVLSLYTYVEIYLMALIQYIATTLDPREFMLIINKIQNIGTISDLLNISIEMLGDQAVSKFTSIINGKIEFQNFRNSIVALVRLKDNIAHKEPLATNQEILELFPYLEKTVTKRTTELLNQQNNSGVPIFDNLMDQVFEALQPAILLDELGGIIFKMIIMTETFVIDQIK